MDIDCNSIETKIIEEQPLSHEEQCHLMRCKSCQDFSLAHAILLNNGMPKPSKSLDNAICKAFSANAIHRARAKSWRRFIVSTAAAVIVICGGICLHYSMSEKNRGSFSLSEQEEWMIDYSLANEEMNDIENTLQIAFLTNSEKSIQQEENLP